MRDMEGKILENVEIIEDHFILTAEVKGRIGDVTPGQFLMVRIDGINVFLRRPFTIYDVDGRTFSIMYKVRGHGTRILSQVKKGQKMYFLGPLGNGFSLKERDLYVVVAGGIGIAGVNLLVKRIGKRVKLFYGTSSSNGVSLLRDLLSYDPIISTMDGSSGYKGDVVSCLSDSFQNFTGMDIEIMACGPNEMYRSLRKALSKFSFPCQVLYEEKMACGMGLCFGCVVETKDNTAPLKRVCFDGPVFSLWDLCL